MRWFDSDFDYVQELLDSWNQKRKTIRTAYFIMAALLIIGRHLSYNYICIHDLFFP